MHPLLVRILTGFMPTKAREERLGLSILIILMALILFRIVNQIV